MVDQKSPAQAEIEILKSRLILGSVIDRLNLDLRISSLEDNLRNRLLQKTEYQTEYQPQYVRFKENDKSFEIRQFEIPAALLDKNLILKFQGQSFSLTDPENQTILFRGALNQALIGQSAQGLWKIEISTRDQFNGNYQIKKLSLPAAINLITTNYSVAEKGKLTGILGLNYQGQDKAHITQVHQHFLGF